MENDLDMIVAYQKFYYGETPTYSRGICGLITAGYGKLDWSGYFEFPLIVDQEDLSIIPLEEKIIRVS